jgi:beta-glucosidase
VMLKAGETRTISFKITNEELSFYNSELKWVSEPGMFHVFVGTNSRDVKQSEFELK